MHALHPFADSKSSEGLKLVYSVERASGEVPGLVFHFTLQSRTPADLARVVIPSLNAQPVRRDELWKSTCLEVFVGRADGAGYLELNLCPSGDWNVYAFDSYRQGMRSVEGVSPLLLKREVGTNGDLITWTASLSGGEDVAALFSGEASGPAVIQNLVMSATAVLEYQSGDRDYWALAHAGPKPDFHLRESFRLIL